MLTGTVVQITGSPVVEVYRLPNEKLVQILYYVSISGGFSTVLTQNPNSLYFFPSYGGLSAMIIIIGLKSRFSSDGGFSSG